MTFCCWCDFTRHLWICAFNCGLIFNGPCWKESFGRRYATLKRLYSTWNSGFILIGSTCWFQCFFMDDSNQFGRFPEQTLSRPTLGERPATAAPDTDWGIYSDSDLPCISPKTVAFTTTCIFLFCSFALHICLCHRRALQITWCYFLQKKHSLTW